MQPRVRARGVKRAEQIDCAPLPGHKRDRVAPLRRVVERATPSLVAGVDAQIDGPHRVEVSELAQLIDQHLRGARGLAGLVLVPARTPCKDRPYGLPPQLMQRVAVQVQPHAPLLLPQERPPKPIVDVRPCGPELVGPPQLSWPVLMRKMVTQKLLPRRVEREPIQVIKVVQRSLRAQGVTDAVVPRARRPKRPPELLLRPGPSLPPVMRRPPLTVPLQGPAPMALLEAPPLEARPVPYVAQPDETHHHPFQPPESLKVQRDQLPKRTEPRPMELVKRRRKSVVVRLDHVLQVRKNIACPTGKERRRPAKKLLEDVDQKSPMTTKELLVRREKR